MIKSIKTIQMYVLKLVWILPLVMSFHYSNAQEQALSELKVKYVNPYVNTIYQIKCDSFERAFKHQIKQKDITDTVLIRAIAKELKKIKYDKLNASIDVRSKFVFLANNETSVLCFNGLNEVLVNGRRIIRNKKLNTLLSNCIK